MSAEHTDPIQAAILARTLAVVRRRGRRRRLNQYAALAGAYLAGAATLWSVAPLWSTSAARTEAPPAATSVAASDPDVAVRRDSPSSGPVDRAAAFEHLRRFRDRVAEVPLAERCELLRAAGDRYLLELDDVTGAVACYQQLLELEHVVGSARPRDETWLLATLRGADSPAHSLTNPEIIP